MKQKWVRLGIISLVSSPGLCLEMAVLSWWLCAICLLMGGAMVPPYWLFLAWDVPALKDVGFWVGLGLHAKTVTSGRAHTHEYSLGLPPPVSLPLVSHRQPLYSQETLQYMQVGLAQATMKSLLWPGSELYASSKSRVSVPPSSVELLHLSPNGLPSQMLWRSSFWCQTSRLRRLKWCSENAILWKNLCDKIIFQFVSCLL